jgi:hypothetical protein
MCRRSQNQQAGEGEGQGRRHGWGKRSGCSRSGKPDQSKETTAVTKPTEKTAEAPKEESLPRYSEVGKEKS